MREHDTSDNPVLTLLTCADAEPGVGRKPALPERSLTLDDIRHLPTITAGQTADLLGVTVDTVTAALGRGELPGVKVGARWCVPVDRLLALLEREGSPGIAAPSSSTTADPTLNSLAVVLRRLADALGEEPGGQIHDR